LGALSSSFGFPVATSAKVSDQYKDVIESRSFVRNLLGRKIQAGDSSVTPASFYGLDGLEERKQVEGLSKQLKNDLDLVKLTNGMISFRMETLDANFSSSFLNIIVSDLEKFFEAKDRKKVERSLEFIKTKIDEKEKAYTQSSERIANFISQNQYLDPQKTPRLFNQLEELKRDQNIQQQIYLVLVQEYEKSQIEKEKDKNLIQVLDYAEPAFKKEKPYRVKIMLAAFFGSIAITFGFLLLRERLKTTA
jgi:uncharacterized protein involved in exopolysaccharide biosynthesis